MEKIKVFAKTIEDEAKEQINSMNVCEAYKDNIVRIMPDFHAGAGCTIGTVIAVTDMVVPNTVGVDIGCGMLVTDLGKIDLDLKEVDRIINERIPSGFSIHENPVTYFDMLNQLHCKDAIDIDFANRSIGSLGGGNHFIEVDVDSKGNSYLVIHSGSRNLGVKVCNHYQEKAVKNLKTNRNAEIIKKLKEEGRENEIQKTLQKEKAAAGKISKDLAYLEGEDLKEYLHDMQICQKYASLNRNTMAAIICEALCVGVHGQFETIHNYIDLPHKILRKGAVSAMNGELLIIPMNMRDGSLICRGKGNLDWLYSAPHGAGRLMSRKKAKETIDIDDFKQSMDGIYTTSVCDETKDEAPMVYKPMQEIMDCIEPTAEIIDVIKPIYNFKAKN